MIMETGSGNEYDDSKQLELPPGFRFYPSDEELISHYLTPKVLDPSFGCLPIGEADLNKCEPWDLPRRAKMGEKEWYFFSKKDRKYPTGLRTNRATECGYWKATGKDKEIYKLKTLVGMKKTLVFYRGRAPKGEKTNWVMHEFRLEGKYSLQNLPKSAKNDWVISRIIKKCSGEKKSTIAVQSENLPPLMDSSPYMSRQSGTEGEGDGSHVTCFSNPSETQTQKAKDELVVDSYLDYKGINTSIPSSSCTFDETPLVNYDFKTQYAPSFAPQPQQGAIVMQDQTSILRTMLESRKWNNNNNMKTELHQPTGLVAPSDFNNIQTPNASLLLPGSGNFHQMQPVYDFDSIWNYYM